MSEDGIIYTGVYMDSQGRGLTMTIGSGFRDRSGQPAGVVCMDFDLTALYDELFSTGLDDGTFVFALDHEGTIISPDSDTLDLQEYTGLNLDQLDELKADPDGIMEIEDSVYICIPVERVGWTMFACVPKTAIQKSIHDADSAIVRTFFVFLGAVLLILLITAYVVNRSITEITHPLELLEKDIKIISNGDLDYRASVYRNDEIGDITSGMNEMVDRLNFTLNELKSSQRHADAMSRLATLDSLTGIRNKTAFDEQTKVLTEEIERGEKRFGFVLLDLNNLKAINDNFGHEKGDLAIKKLCDIICEVFVHSPVFRVGGDEFVVLVKDHDYDNVVELVEQFMDRTVNDSGDADREPWEHIRAAVGYAIYDEAMDSGTDSVLSRADKEMYACKKAMKES